MDIGTTNNLWSRGPAAWNKWAHEMLSRPDRETAAWSSDALAHFGGRRFRESADLTGFLFPKRADFSLCTFDKRCDFSKASFHGDVYFEKVKFLHPVSFDRALFSGNTFFTSCAFHDDARFERCRSTRQLSFHKCSFSVVVGFNSSEIDQCQFNDTIFREGARFFDCVFNGAAVFSEVTFDKRVNFSRSRFVRQATFEQVKFMGSSDFAESDFAGASSFSRSVFVGIANFRAAKSEGSFDMAGATFHEVPNFIQATFAEAPRLDNVVVQRGGPVQGEDDVRRDDLDDDLPARWRALKRLALQGHDHIREQEYFAEEVKALRGNSDKPLPNPLNWFKKTAHAVRQPVWPGGGRYWLGLVYQCLSNFGRSAARPVLWWMVLSSGFAYFYLRHHFAASAQTGTAYVGGAGGWLWSHAVQHLLRLGGSPGSPSDAALFPISCIRGEGTPFWEALGLSLNKALPLSGIGSPEKLNQIYACLYGIHGGGRGALPERFTPVIPDLVYYLGMVQTLFSLVLIFLFLLALRNHFRIR